MSDSQAIRIQKYLSEQGICSRRQADALIADGLVSLNGDVVEPGTRMIPGKDELVVEGRRIRPKKRESVVLLLNKPKGFLCTNHDPHSNRTIFQLLPSPYDKEKLFCAGRLDKDSEGMVILTNDGELGHRITHPSGGITKRYRVTLNRPFDLSLIPTLTRGIINEGERLYAKKIIPLAVGAESTARLEVHLQQGRKREIRRLFSSVGFFVKKLERFQMGALKLQRLAPGQLRELKSKEIDMLLKSV